MVAKKKAKGKIVEDLKIDYGELRACMDDLAEGTVLLGKLQRVQRSILLFAKQNQGNKVKVVEEFVKGVVAIGKGGDDMTSATARVMRAYAQMMNEKTPFIAKGDQVALQKMANIISRQPGHHDYAKIADHEIGNAPDNQGVLKPAANSAEIKAVATDAKPAKKPAGRKPAAGKTAGATAKK